MRACGRARVFGWLAQEILLNFDSMVPVRLSLGLDYGLASFACLQLACVFVVCCRVSVARVCGSVRARERLGRAVAYSVRGTCMHVARKGSERKETTTSNETKVAT